MYLNGKQASLHKIVLEVRYSYGYSYLDKCGRILNTLLREFPEWIVRSGPDPNSTGLVSTVNGCLLSFSGVKYDFAIDAPFGGDKAITDEEVTTFVSQVGAVAPMLHEVLGLREFDRLGFRQWFLFPSDGKRGSERWLSDLGIYKISPALPTSFKGDVDSVGVAVVIAGPDRKFRFAFNGVERQAQLDLGQEILGIRASALPKNQREVLRKQQQVKRRMLISPEFGVLIDIDGFQENPSSVEPGDFIETTRSLCTQGLAAFSAQEEGR